MDDLTSPAIDAGNPFDYIDEEPLPHGGRINIGVYGGMEQASKSISGLSNIADLNSDGVVDLRDYAIFAENWLWTAQ